MKVTRVGVSLLVMAGFAAGVAAAPSGGRTMRGLGVEPAAAQGVDQQQTDTLPVSYTHLDVYKRQLQGFPPAL